MLDLNDYSLFAIFPVSLIVILGAGEVGHWLGERAALRGAPRVSTLEGAILGLLALMIGFTFAMALSRFEARRDGVAEGSEFDRHHRAARPPAAGAVRQGGPEALAQLRAASARSRRRAPYPAGAQATIDRSNAIQEALWQQAKAVAAEDNAMVPTGLFFQSLNEMIDDQEKRLAAANNRLPIIVLVALYGVAIVAIGFAGYGAGCRRIEIAIAGLLTGMLVAAMVLLIQDIDRPGAGFIRVSQQPMINAAATHRRLSRLAASMKRPVPLTGKRLRSTEGSRRRRHSLRGPADRGAAAVPFVGAEGRARPGRMAVGRPRTGRARHQPDAVRRHRLPVVHRRGARPDGRLRGPAVRDGVPGQRPAVPCHDVRRERGVRRHGRCPGDAAREPRPIRRLRSRARVRLHIVNVYAIKMAGVFMLITSTLAVRTAFVARWMAAPGFAMALFLLFGSQWIDWSFIVFPAWALLVSVYILIANLHHAPTT